MTSGSECDRSGPLSGSTRWPQRLAGARWARPRRPSLALTLLAAIGLAAIVSGCQYEAQNKSYNFCGVNTQDPQNCLSGTGSGTGQVIFLWVDLTKQVITFLNQDIATHDMTNWIIQKQSGPPALYTFPSFSLLASGYVRVHFLNATATSSSTDLYTGTNLSVLANTDTLSLLDGSTPPNPISFCGINSLCWSGTP